MDQLERGLRLGVVGLTAAVVLALAVTQAGPSRTGADRDAAAAMVSMVNEVRAEHDLPALVAAPDVARVAERWSEQMALAGEMLHNPRHGEQICCWSTVTENVAFADPPRIWRPGDPVLRLTEELHQGLLSSPGHRANILDDGVDQVGIGVHVAPDGRVWITQNFRRYAG